MSTNPDALFVACPVCHNDFIELFGSDARGWWTGCKPCSKRDGGPEHIKAPTRAKAIEAWRSYVEHTYAGSAPADTRDAP